jgi:polar amino acid transport system substrate-binding protein
MRTINQRAGGKPFEAKLVIKQFPIAMGVKKGETALQNKLNEWISANAKTGKLNAIYKKYHEIDVPAEFLK